MNGFSEKLEELRISGNLRRLPETSHDGKYSVMGGRRMLNLSSNDYLGLASGSTLPLMKDFLREAGLSCGTAVPEDFLLGSTSSRLLTGTFDVHSRLERALCGLSGRQSALVFGSGYHMNVGILPAVTDSSSVILADKLVHASIIDGIRLSSARSVRFRHQDMDQLESLVEKYGMECSRIVIVTESIFSMDGDLADLKRLVDIKRKHPQVMLYVDEAHAVGVRGDTGMGLAQELGVMQDIDFLCGTFGKAVASAGAYVLCESAVREYLVNRMRPLIFSTALPPLNVLWTLRVMENLVTMGSMRQALSDNAARIREFIRSRGVVCPSGSHIIPVMAGDSHRAIAMAEEMQCQGFYLLPIRPPTVPEGTSRLRISLTAAITRPETDALINVLGRLLP